MSTDLVSDMLTRIRNGYLVHKKNVDVSYSKFKEELARVLVKEGYVSKYEIIKKETPQKTNQVINITLKYDRKTSALEGIKRISKPGLRVYKNKHNLPRVLGGLGTAIISTSQGLMTSIEAKKKGLGGEIICQIW